MPAPLLSKDEVLGRLLETFRKSGYDGASLSELSRVTGLGKSSLYHHFPGGKEDMALAVLAFLEARLEQALFEPLGLALPPRKKLELMLETLLAFYDRGRRACLLERLAASTDRARFRRPLGELFRRRIAAVEGLCVEAGLPAATARARAEDLVVRVEGALVVSAGTGDPELFERTLKSLGRTIFTPA